MARISALLSSLESQLSQNVSIEQIATPYNQISYRDVPDNLKKTYINLGNRIAALQMSPLYRSGEILINLRSQLHSLKSCAMPREEHMARLLRIQSIYNQLIFKNIPTKKTDEYILFGRELYTDRIAFLIGMLDNKPTYRV